LATDRFATGPAFFGGAVVVEVGAVVVVVAVVRPAVVDGGAELSARPCAAPTDPTAAARPIARRRRFMR
jgi:hypothetical protein